MIYASTVDMQEAYEVGRHCVEIAATRGHRLDGHDRARRRERLRRGVRPNAARRDGVQRRFPAAWISPSNFDVTDDFVRYAQPLIGAAWPRVPLADGRQRFARLAPIFADKKMRRDEVYERPGQWGRTRFDGREQHRRCRLRHDGRQPGPQLRATRRTRRRVRCGGQRQVDFLRGEASGRQIAGAESLAGLVRMLVRPRRVLLLVPAGDLAACIDALQPLFEAGDILIDGGNSEYMATEQRVQRFEAAGRLYVGAGISGGTEVVRHGPAIMPGGSAAAWPHIQPLLEKIAAGAPDCAPCCAWIGPGGAGHSCKNGAQWHRVRRDAGHRGDVPPDAGRPGAHSGADEPCVRPLERRPARFVPARNHARCAGLPRR